MHAAIYIRKSREEKDKESHRLTVQREQLPAHASAQGWTHEIYDDGHASAARGKTENLQERGRLEKDIRAGRIGVILCIELSRLSRDDSMQDYVAWLHLCSEHRVKLATMGRILDPSQHSDWMLLLMEGGFSSVEMKVLKGRMEEGWKQAFQAGKWLGGTPPPPYAYDAAAGRPVVDPESLERMERLWKLAETDSAAAIAHELRMPEIAVRRAISDERLLMYQALREDPETGNMIKCDWQPVMDADQAARIRSGRRRRKTNAGPHVQSLLAGLDILKCGYCGRTMKTWCNHRVRQDGTKLNYYGCQVKSTAKICNPSRMIAQPVLNRLVTGHLVKTLSDSHLREYWLRDRDNAGPVERLQEIEADRKKLLQQKDRLVKAVAAGVMELQDIKDEMTRIKAALDDLILEEKKTQALITRPPDWEKLRITREQFAAAPHDLQRELLKIAITRVEVFHGYAVIAYAFPRNAKGSRTARINLPDPGSRGTEQRFKA